MSVTDQVVAGTPCVSCHHDGTYTYYDHFVGDWLHRMPFVPAHVMARLPTDERDRVARRAWHRLGAGYAPAAAPVRAQTPGNDPGSVTGPPQRVGRSGYAVHRPTFLRVQHVKQGAGGVVHV